MPHIIKRFLDKNWHWLAIALLSILYLALMWDRPFMLFDWADWDDTMQYNLSRSFTEGNWLGPYNRATLIKGPAFPVWTSLLHNLHIPLWFGSSLFMIISCLALIYALRKLIDNRLILILVYAALLFNPLVTDRAYRDLIIPQLTILLCAWAIGLFAVLSKKNKSTPIGIGFDFIVFTLIGTISLPLWFLTREDGVWILPSLALIIFLGFLYFILPIRKRVLLYKKTVGLLIVAVITPFLAVIASNAVVSSLNQHYYGRYVTNDYFSSDFKDAYAALARVKYSGPEYQTIPVPYEARKKLYAVSPSFKELESCLDTEKSICSGFKKTGPNSNRNEYEGGWFPFAIRLAVDQKGYYKNAVAANGYYARIYDEVTLACQNGKIDCYPIRVYSMMSVPTAKTIDPFIDNIGRSLSFITILPLSNNDHLGAVGKTAFLDDMAHYYGVRYIMSATNVETDTRSSLLKSILCTYQSLNPIVLMMSIVTLICATVAYLLKRFSNWRLLFITWVIFLTLLLRITMLAYIYTVSFPTTTAIYYASAYVLLFLFEGLSVYLLVALFGAVLNKRRS